jgi:putative ABC transport system permease protein
VLQTLVTREGRRRSGKVVGIDTTYFDLLNLNVAEGKRFAAMQVADGAPVAVIGHGVRTRFFTTEEPIGKPIKVGNVWLTVVGVLEDRKVSSQTSQKLGIRDANMDVYVPLSTMLLRYRNRAQVTERDVQQASREFNDDPNATQNEDAEQRAERTNYHQLDRIIVRVDEAKYVTGVADVLQRMLTRRHNSVIDFEISVPELLLKQEQNTKRLFNIVLAAIAAISLVVGGIGIMNIMLASILERTREIGVRRAVGASQRDILAQFLSEAVLISLAGGVAGIIVGGVLSFTIERLADIQTIVSFFSVFIAFGVSITVGIVFGIVPAWRAAKQDPVVCLRYE